MSYFSFKHYDFSHLDAFSLPYLYEEKDKPSKKLNINIEFGFHCFTSDLFYYDKGKRIQKDHIQQDYLITHKNEQREFDLLRYEQSKYLPTLIKNLFADNSNICFNTAKINKGKIVYFRKETLIHNSVSYEYYIFFNSTKDHNILLFITSAYHREDEYYKQCSKNKIKLNTIIKKTLFN